METCRSHIALRQSSRLTQPWPLGQRGQSGPPQSTPVSLPFLTPSLQLAGAQAPSWQAPPAQIVPFGRFARHFPFLRVLQGRQGYYFFFLAVASSRPERAAPAARAMPSTERRGANATRRRSSN